MQPSIYIYDSQSGQKKLFEPIVPGQVSLYVCGMTVYDYCHIGHARGMVVFDVIAKYFKNCGYRVNYVRNITDIDDKIIKRAQEAGTNAELLTQKFIDAMHEDIHALGIDPVQHEPKATDYIEPMINLIAQLIDKKHAYVGDDGDVYFSIDALSSYGQLSHRNVNQLLQGVRIAVKSAKRYPLDFVLWKQAKPGEPQWDSPWGPGRPGWHSECVVMSTQLLGQPFDIHGGGMDLKFPHHENELAQASCVSHGSFAHFWMHVGLLQVNSEKMSKSLNNFITIRDALAEVGPEVLRYFYLSGHYRSPVNYNAATMDVIKRSLDGLYTALRDLDNVTPKKIDTDTFESSFHAAMCDDFNTPQALAVLFDMAHEINRLKQVQLMSNAAYLANEMRHLAQSLGLLHRSCDDYFCAAEIDHAAVDALIVARNQARADKDWSRADALRDQLLDMGIVIEDGQGGSRWRHVGVSKTE